MADEPGKVASLREVLCGVAANGDVGMNSLKEMRTKLRGCQSKMDGSGSSELELEVEVTEGVVWEWDGLREGKAGSWALVSRVILPSFPSQPCQPVTNDVSPNA